MCKESKTKQNAVSTTAIPSWLEDASKTLTEKSVAAAEKPFEAYTGDRVAELNPDQLNAFQRLRDFISSGETPAQIREASTAPAQTVGTERVVDENGRLGAMKDYFNPFVEGALQPALTKIQEAADARRKQINAGATAARAFGDARHGITESQLDLDTSRAIGETAGKFYSDAFDKTIAARTGDLNRFADVDKTNAQFGETALNREISGATTLQNQLLAQLQAALGAGAIQQGTEQQKLDAVFQEFIRQYQHDPAQLQALSTVLAKLPYSKTQTTDATTTTPDNSLLGLAGSVGGSVLGSAPVSNAIAGYLGSVFGPSTAAAAGSSAAGLAALAAI